MSIRQFDLARQHESLREELDRAWRRVAASNRFVLATEVAAFEHELASYLGGGVVVGVNSGSDALHLALRLMDIGPGDEVVLPSYGFAATLEAVLRIGAVPKFVDCAPMGFNSQPMQIQDALSPKTRAVIVVHLFGLPVDLSSIAPVCRARGIALIEDAAQALGATSPAGKMGTLADVGCFSFYPSKNLGALGDGGALWVAHAEQAERLRRLRNHGYDRARKIQECGLNSRLDEIQAAMLRVKLPHLDDWIAARKRIASIYQHALRNSGFLVAETSQPAHSFNQFSILHPHRDRLRDWLQEHGIETRIYYEQSLHLHPAIRSGVELPHAERHAQQALALPIYPELQADEATRVCETINAFGELSTVAGSRVALV